MGARKGDYLSGIKETIFVNLIANLPGQVLECRHLALEQSQYLEINEADSEDVPYLRILYTREKSSLSCRAPLNWICSAC